MRILRFFQRRGAQEEVYDDHLAEIEEYNLPTKQVSSVILKNRLINPNLHKDQFDIETSLSESPQFFEL